MSSTSFFNYDSDKGNISFLRKNAYWVCNIIENFIGNYLSFSKVPTLPAKLKPLHEIEPFINYKSSPSRLFSDAFLESLPVNNIVKELETIRMIDIGCGKGHYFRRLNRIFGERLEKYVGIDIKRCDEWDNLEKNFKSKIEFSTQNRRVLFNINRNYINFVLSISALEHIEDDLDLFYDIKKFLITDIPFIQIHLIPSAPCLKLYRKHGCRQYTPGSAIKIKKVFSDKNDTCIFLICLGGPQANKLHFEYITKPLYFKKPPVDYRETKTKEYKEALIKCYNNKINCLFSNPSFYALIIESNLQESVFSSK